MFTHGRASLVYIDLPVMAQPLLEWLRSNEVDARLNSDDVGGLHPALTFANGTWLTVPETQIERARELLSAFERSMTLIDESFPSDEGEDGDESYSAGSTESKA